MSTLPNDAEVSTRKPTADSVPAQLDRRKVAAKRLPPLEGSGVRDPDAAEARPAPGLTADRCDRACTAASVGERQHHLICKCPAAQQAHPDLAGADHG